MTCRYWLEKSIKVLESAGIATASLDAQILLADSFELDRSWVLAHPEEELSDKQEFKLNQQIIRRQAHEPIAYIRGKQEFYGRTFAVSPATLTPRPETETMVEIALALLASEPELKKIHDIGSGSGCIAITIDVEATHKRSIAGFEISKEAIAIARQNAENLFSSAKFYQADITDTDDLHWADCDMIVANLPYVPDEFKINLAATHEPLQAIYGGADGLDYYRVLFSHAADSVKLILTESLPPQHIELASIANDHGYTLESTTDFIQQFRKVN